MAVSGALRRDEDLESKVTQLVEMGFEDKQARFALQKTSGNIGRAIRWLSGVPESGLTSSLPAGSGSYHSQINFGPSMTFHTVNCNNVMIGHNQKMTVVENHIHHHGMHAGWWKGRGQGPAPAKREAARQLMAVPTGTTERDGGAVPQKKSCFISYYADTAEERNYVLWLSSALRENGIDCEADVYHEDNPPPNWAVWVEKEITSRDVTLISCSEAYFRHLREQHRVHRDRVHFEGRIMYSLLSTTSSNRFVPIFLGADNPINLDYVPVVLRSSSMYHISKFPLELKKEGHEQFTSLYAFLSGQERSPAPTVGEASSFA